MEKRTIYVSVDEIQKQIINMSKKKIRKFLHQYLPVKKIGKRLYVNRNDLEQLLNNPNRENFPIDFEM